MTLSKGEDDAQRLDHTGLRSSNVATHGSPVEEHEHLMHHIEDVHAGRFVVVVLANERSKREVAADILNAPGAEFIGF